MFDITPETIQSNITDKVKEKLNTPSSAKAFGRSVATGMGEGGVSQNNLEGQIGKAVADELPNASTLNTLPKAFMGFQRGGFMGGLQNLGNMAQQSFASWMGTKAAEVKLPPALEQAMGAQFQGSPAARGGAEEIAPVVNNAFDHLVSKSPLKIFSGTYLSDKAKEFGLGGSSAPTPPGVAGNQGSTA